MRVKSGSNKAETGGRRVAYLVSAFLGVAVAIFGGIAAYFYLTTTGPNDIVGIFLAFVWTFLSVTVELVVLARAGLFRQSEDPIESSPPEHAHEPKASFQSSVFYGVTHEVSVSAEAEIKDPVLRRWLIIFMLTSAVCLLIVEIALYRAGRSTIGGFLFSCIPLAFMAYWAWLKRPGQETKKSAPTVPAAPSRNQLPDDP